VDDVDVNRSLLRELLEPLGFELTEAASAEEMLENVGDTAPDGVILDLRMPGMDGLELTRRLRKKFGVSQPRIVLMSASVLAFDPQIAFDAGADDFLPKPFRESELLDRLGRCLKLDWTQITTSVESAPETDSEDTRGDRAPADSDPTADYKTVLEQLSAFAQRGDVRGIRKRIEALDSTHGNPRLQQLVDQLRPLVAAYQMDRMRDVLHRSRENSSATD
jgi:CheY-like chemotaxis protein